MLDQGKQNVLGVAINATDYDGATAAIIRAAKEKRALTVSALAVHGVVTGALDPVHRHRLNRLDLVVPDGQPVRWAMNWLYNVTLPDRVYGPELTLRVCERAAAEGLAVYLYGSRPEVLAMLRTNLLQKFPKLVIAGSQPSRFRQTTEEEQLSIANEIRESGASIVLVGLGCPRQETWIFEYRELLPMPLMAVGAAFDFHAGLLRQAPRWFQDNGLEWFYRLVQEPRRLWRRYAVTNSLYVLLVVLQWARLRRFDLEDTVTPSAQMRFG